MPNPFDLDFDLPDESDSTGTPYTPTPLVDGEMRGYELASELQRREDIGTILQNNPQAETYQILYGLNLQRLDTYSHSYDHSLVSLVLQKPPKAGLKDFLQELCVRAAQAERPDLQEQLGTALTFTVDTLLKRKVGHNETPDLTDILLALHIAKALPVATTDELRTLATSVLPVLVEKAPAQLNDFVAAFGIPPEAVRKATMRVLYDTQTIAKLRNAQVAVPSNDDPEFRNAALELVKSGLKFGRTDTEEYRRDYELPEAEYKDAVWIGLIGRLSLPFGKCTVAEFLAQLKAYNIELRPNDPEARSMLLEDMKYALDEQLEKVQEIQNLFRFTADEMQQLREDDGARVCKATLEQAPPNIAKLKKIAAILHMSDSALQKMVRDMHQYKIGRDWEHTETWEQALVTGHLLTPATIREDLEQALRTGITENKNWTLLQKIFTRLGGDAAARLQPEETVTVAKKRYLDQVRNGSLYDIAEMEKLCDLSLIQGTDEEREAAKEGVRHQLVIAAVNIPQARKVLEKYHLTEADLQQAAEAAAITHLGACWFAQLEAVCSNFPVEDALRSAKQASGKAVYHFAVQLKHNKDMKSYERNRDKRDTYETALSEEQCEQILKTIAIGGYDPDAIEQGLRTGDYALIPTYEAENLPGFLILLRRCPEGFEQAFSRDDVRDHAAETYLVPALESGDEKTAKEHIELTSFPKERLREIGYEAFVRAFQQERYTVAFTAARICSVDDAKVAEMLATQMQSDYTKILPHLEEIPVKVLDRLEREFSLRSYTDDIGIPSAAIYSRYSELVAKRDPLAVTAFVSSIQEQLNRVTSGGRQDASITSQPFYRDIIQAAYPNNAGQWTSFDKNEACEDRSDDLANYTVRDHYSFTVAPGQDMVLKNGRQKDRAGFTEIHTPLEQIHKQYESTGFEREAMLTRFDQEIGSEAANLQPAEAYTNREEKICGLFLEQMQGTYPPHKLKHVLMSYQYAAFQDIREYLQGTRARAEQSRNPEYAYLLELREFFADRLKDVARKILEAALQNPALRAQLPQYFQRCRAHETSRTEGQEVARMQIDKLGLTPGFIKQLCTTLQRRTGRAYTETEARALIREYEERTAGMAETAIPEGVDPAIAGQIRAQRTKTIRAMSVLSGINVHPSEIHLEDVNLQELLNERRSMVGGEYDEEVFGSYMGRRFSEVFGSELSFIDAEIAKYEAKDATGDAKAKRIEAFITKNHTSAHARATAGVCVSGDNPRVDEETKEPMANQWQQPNYLQMILRDSETKLCKGCVLMHVEEDQGQKILTVSLNPSSTYLYQVNEEEMFRNLRDQLITFATDNNFDAIAVSNNKQIRTNRTGGLFERAMDAAIAETKQKHTFSTERVFSHKPRYKQTDLDFIWVAKPKVVAPPTEPVLAA